MNAQYKPLFLAITNAEPSVRAAKNYALILNDYLSKSAPHDDETREALALIAIHLLEEASETEAAYDRIWETYKQQRRGFDECA